MSATALQILDQIHALPEGEQRLLFAELSKDFDETAYLLATAANTAEIERGLADYEARRFEEHALVEP